MSRAATIRLLVMAFVAAHAAAAGAGEAERGGRAAAEPDSLNLTGAVYRGDATDDALTDLLLVELSRQERVRALERRELQLLLREQALNAVIGDAWRQARLGRLLGVDAFVWIRLREGQAELEVVEAATGRGIAAHSQAVGEGLASALPDLARRAVAAARRGPPPVDRNAPTLAVGKPTFEAGTEGLGPAAESVLQALAQDLSQAGLAVLHRRFVEDLALERWMQEKGLTEAEREHLPMLGARFILVPRLRKDEPQLALSLLETSTGRRVGSRTWALNDAQKEAGRAAMAGWVRQRTDPAAAAGRRQPAPSTGRGDAPLQPETLAPFYRGVLLHNAGRYLEGAAEFRSALRSDRRFLEPFRWIQSCFLGAGFDEVAEAFASHVARAQKDIWSGINNPKALHAAPGVALLGLTAAPQVSPPQSLSATVALMDGLHGATGAPVFVTADMAQLRDELDALLGLEQVAGTTWQQAPPLLFADTLTAHFEHDGGRGRLRVCVTHGLDPGQIAAVCIALDDDPRNWQGQIAEATRPLLAQAATARPAWKRPPAVLPQTQPKDRAAPVEEFALNYLHRVARNPEDVTGLRFPYSGDWFQDVMMPGLHRWLVRTLPDTSRVKPRVEFAYVTYYARGPAELKRLAQKYPSDPVGILARLSVLLREADDTNLAETQASLEKLLEELRPHVPAAFSRLDFETYRDTNRLLRRALGKPDGSGELKPGGPPWVIMGEGPIQIRAGGTYPGTLKYPGRVANPQYRAIVDLAILRCAWRNELDIPAATVRQLFERFANQPDALAYFCVTYANKLFTNHIRPMTQDDLRALAALYPTHARIVASLLRQDPLPFDWLETTMLVRVHPTLAGLGASDAEFRAAREQVQQAVLDAIRAGRFQKLGPHEVSCLLVEVAGRGSPKVIPFLKTLADRSLAGDPLQDKFWRVYAQWDERQSAAERLKRYLPFYERVRQLHPQIVIRPESAQLYFDFGLVCFRGGRFDLAEDPLTAVANLDDPRAVALPELRANASYLLALMRQRDRNAPEALHWAKRAIDEIGDRQIGLITGIGVEGGRSGRGSTSNLKSLATDLIARLRSDPNAPFQSPFGDP